MDYEKKYKDALANARQEYNTTENAERKQWLEEFFSELKEDEDERIRKTLIEFFGRSAKYNCFTSGISDKDILAWLEKQSDKDKLIKELGEYKVKYTQGVLEQHLNGVNKDNERLIKTTIAFLKEFAEQGYENAVECIDWLEKQGQTFTKKNVDDAYLKGVCDAKQELEKQNENTYNKELSELLHKVICRFINDPNIPYSDREKVSMKVLPYVEQLEKQVGQPTDKVEPKFHKGEWIVCCDYEPVQIIGIRTNTYYEMSNGDIRPIYMVDNNHNIRLWTIQDAKDGDVLFQDLMGGKTFIYNGVDADMAILYSFIISNDDKDVLPYHIGKPNTGIGNIIENKVIIHPATKEQCDLLFSKMKEAGYEWDAEKKELKKIEHKSVNTYCRENCKGYQLTGRCFADGECQAKRDNDKKIQQKTKKIMFDEPVKWSGEDESNLDLAIYYIRREPYRENDVEPIIDWLRNLKERVQFEQKWSEEDNLYYDDICEILVNLLYSKSPNVNKSAIQKDLDWFITFVKQTKNNTKF